jgi:hypothetical protein
VYKIDHSLARSLTRRNPAHLTCAVKLAASSDHLIVQIMSHPAASVSATTAFFASSEQAHFARQWAAGYVDELRNPGAMEEYPLSNAQALKLRKLFAATAEQGGTKFTFGEGSRSESGSRPQLGMTLTKGNRAD